MTSYSGMAARGREASAATTTGRRKVTAERIEYGESNVVGLDGNPPAWATVPGYLIGSCGHRLRWLAAVPVHNGEPQPRPYLTEKLGRKMTCPHDDCKIPPKPPREPRDDDCTWHTSKDDEDGRPVRCTVRAQWRTHEGDVCTRHRTYLIEWGYLARDDAGERIKR